MSLLTPLAAENLTICPLFEKLLNNANDFKPLMAGKDPSLPMRTLSTIQLDGAESSRFTVGINDVTFEAELGRYPTHLDALKMQNKWTKALMECYPGMKFGVRHEKILSHTFMYTYPILKNETTIRVFTAAFVIKKIFDTYDLVFECKQAQEKSRTQREIVAFTDHTIVTADRENTPFTEALLEVLYQATIEFEEIKGNVEDENNDGRYPATLKLPGFDNCYVDTEDYTAYVVSVCKDVDQETLQAKLPPFIQLIASALGKEYAYRLSKEGNTIYYIRGNNPDKVIATLTYTVRDGLYSALFIVWEQD